MSESNDLLLSEALGEALEGIDRPDSFCTSGSVPAVSPGLEVHGVGPVGLPLSREQLKALKRAGEQAPYGKGRQTLVDTEVRRVWHLTPDRFALTNPAWAALLEQTVATVQADLGLEGQKLDAHLYDLLLYEPGGFFLSHRDGEKLDRMVATLVVVLPSKHEGGELIVRHEGRERKIGFAGPGSLSQVHFAAFYSDCEHEVRPLRSGHRLCLVYNLTLAKSRKAPDAPRGSTSVAEVARVLRGWKKGPGEPLKLAVLMGHRYSQDGLSWGALKGVDRTKARVLAEAARQAGCHAHLALLTFWQSGAVEDEYGGYGGYGEPWYDEEEHDEGDEGGDEDEGDDEDEGGGQYKMTDVLDESLSADHWRSPDDRPAPFGRIPVGEDEVVPPDSLKSVKPQEEYEGYTGNEGMTLERWYRHAAVVLWPEAAHLDILLKAGSHASVAALEQMVADWRAAKGAAVETMKARCLKFARRVLDEWPTTESRNDYAGWVGGDWRGRSETGGKGAEQARAADPMAALRHLDDPRLIGTYLGKTLARDASLTPGAAAVKAVVRHGWASFRPDLLKLFRATTVETLERNVHFLLQLCQAAHDRSGVGSESAAREGRRTCRLLAETMVAALVRVDAEEEEPEDWDFGRVGRTKWLDELGRALLTAGLDGLLSTVIDHVQGAPAHYPLRPVQLPGLSSLVPWVRKTLKRTPAPLRRWVVQCRRQLEAMTAAEPQPPADFQRAADVACRCADCTKLKKFLRDPQRRVETFAATQGRRKHLKGKIDECGCDATCGTDKRSRPHALVCTKNDASHRRRLMEYHDDLKLLASVRAMEKKLRV